jgi:hypothetical protein
MNSKTYKRFLFASALACGAFACSEEELLLGTTNVIVDATTDQCMADGIVVLTGVDRNQDGALEADEISAETIICSGVEGDPGTDGVMGTSSLIRTSNDVGDNCPNSGIRVDVGLDVNGDGELDSSETEQTAFVCAGLPGTDGLVTRTRTRSSTTCEGGLVFELGLDTDESADLEDDEVTRRELLCPGDDGLETLLITSEESSGPNCVVGGLRLEKGIDSDRSGVLEPDEIEETRYVCDPVRTLISVIPEPADTSTVCDDGGSRIETGPDLDADNELDDAEVNSVNFACNGSNGLTSLIATTPEPVGPNCAVGGTRIEVGSDDNRDGILQEAEVSTTRYVCNGNPGVDGAGNNASRIADEAPGANCATGGVRIETGSDLNDNGVLDDGEVTDTQYACNGGVSETLVTTADEPAGANCADGGIRIDSGIDIDQNGTLEPSEVTNTAFVCDADPGTVPLGIIDPAALPNIVNIDVLDVDIEARGGTAGSYSWSIISGNLPSTFTIEPTGTPSTVLSGSTTSTGTFTFTVQVEDFFGNTAQRTYTLTVDGAPCGPGLDGATGQSLTEITVPSSFGFGVRGMATDTSTGGWVYWVDPGDFLNRFRKDGSAVESDLQDLLAQVAPGDIGYEIDIDGNDIYLTSDDSSCSSTCVYRVSDDGGVTFSFRDIGDFSSAPTGGDLRGIAVQGLTMYAITHGSSQTELYSLDLSASLPVAPTLTVTFTDLESCAGLEADDTYLYTVCDDDGSGDNAVVRIDIASLNTANPAFDVLLQTPSFFTVGSDIISAVYGEDLDADGEYDILYVTGDSGDDLFLCDPAGPLTTEPFNREWLDTFSGDDEGMAFDRVNQVLYKVDESSPNVAAFD